MANRVNFPADWATLLGRNGPALYAPFSNILRIRARNCAGFTGLFNIGTRACASDALTSSLRSAVMTSAGISGLRPCGSWQSHHHRADHRPDDNRQ
jgi:hypothetical protein